MSDIIVIVNGKYGIKWKHTFEKELDKTINQFGLSRTGSSTNDKGDFEIYFRQFGICEPIMDGSEL